DPAVRHRLLLPPQQLPAVRAAVALQVAAPLERLEVLEDGGRRLAQTRRELAHAGHVAARVAERLERAQDVELFAGQWVAHSASSRARLRRIVVIERTTNDQAPCDAATISHPVPPETTSPRDLLGRSLRNLRLSVTDRCNLRCQYCM